MSRILVVEDDVEVVEALCQVLERMGHETRLAIDGSESQRRWPNAIDSDRAHQ